MSFASNISLLALALSVPLAAGPSTANAAAADTGSLTCELAASNVVVTNNGSETLAAGTKILIRFYPAAGVVSAPRQKIVPLKSELAPGSKTTFGADSSGPIQGCEAHKA